MRSSLVKNRRYRHKGRLLRAFWDFYALENLYSHLSWIYGVNQKKLDYIRELYEKTVYSLFSSACEALERSVRWEIRHGFDMHGMSRQKQEWLKKRILKRFNIKKIPSRHRMPLEMIAFSYNQPKLWNTSYGGAVWGKATEFLIKAKPYVTQHEPNKWAIYLDGIFV